MIADWKPLNKAEIDLFDSAAADLELGMTCRDVEQSRARIFGSAQSAPADENKLSDVSINLLVNITKSVQFRRDLWGTSDFFKDSYYFSDKIL